MMWLRHCNYVVLFSTVLVVVIAERSADAQDIDTLKARARATFKRGDYAQAIKEYEQAVAAATRAYGANDQRTDVLVNELGASYYKQGRYQDAEPRFQQVLRNTEARVGPQDTEVATCLNNLGLLYDDMGDYNRAEAIYLRAYRIRETALGKNHPDLATNLNNLAAVYRSLGDDARAVALYRQSLQLYEAKLGRDDPLVANSLSNLAGAYSGLGQFDQAEPLYQRALKIRETKLGADHPSVATIFNNLAGMFQAQKKYDQAEQFYRKTLKIRQAKLGADHPDVARTLNNLGSLEHNRGNYAEAETLYRQALAIREAKLGKEHPEVGESLNNVAGVLKDTGKLEEAEAEYQRSLQLRQARYGNEHPDVAQSYSNLAFLQARLERWEQASAAFDRSRRIVRRHVGQILPTLTDAEQLAFLKVTDEHFLHGALSLGLQRREDPKIVELSAAWVLNAKGISQESVAQRMVLARDLTDPATAPDVKKLQDVRRELSRLARLARSSTDAGSTRRMEELRLEEFQVSRRLAEVSGRPSQTGGWVELADVRRAIPKNSVLVEIARFRVRDFKARGADEGRWQSPHYAAWIIPAAEQGAVKLLDLGEADAIEAAVVTVREALVAAVPSIRMNGEAEAEQELLQPMGALAKLVLTPIAAELGEAEGVILSPDATLWLVPWSALPVADKPVTENQYAIEKYRLGYVVSGRDLIGASTAPKANPAIILADPDYDLAMDTTIAAIKTLFRGQVPKLLMRVKPAVELPPVPRLPGTAAEAKAIAPKLEAFSGKAPLSYTAQYALEGVVKAIRSPQVLVVSTHGFFRDDEQADDEGDAGLSANRRAKPLENPLLRCGLLLTGCNTRNLSAQADTDDGVLTGFEIVGTDLRGTQLVVLSACETGLGKVRNGEGVAGLRQAFQIAGAQAVMATLWEIPDAQTARLINDFFTNLSEGKSKTDALRQAQRTMIDARRERNGAAHPFFWAAFTVTGRP